MRQGILYVFAAGALALMISMAWWTQRYSAEHYQPQVYTVQVGDTAVSIAQEHGTAVIDLAKANSVTSNGLKIAPGQQIIIPPPSPTPASEWATHALGIAGTVLGVFMSLWLALVAGLLPRGIRRQVLGISLVLGLTSYATTYAVAGAPVQLTPAYLFGAIKDGFAWAAAFPMLARALGIRDAPAKAMTPAPQPAAHPGEDAAPPPADAAPGG
jgi:LysM repeat protein